MSTKYFLFICLILNEPTNSRNYQDFCLFDSFHCVLCCFLFVLLYFLCFIVQVLTNIERKLWYRYSSRVLYFCVCHQSIHPPSHCAEITIRVLHGVLFEHNRTQTQEKNIFFFWWYSHVIFAEKCVNNERQKYNKQTNKNYLVVFEQYL